MKRNIFITITALICCLIIPFATACGCGCNAVTLNFNDNYTPTGTGNALDGYTETAVYDVSFKLGEKATSTIVGITSGDYDLKGTYEIKFTHSNLNALKEKMNADDDFAAVTKDYEGAIYVLTTALYMEGSYKIGEETIEFKGENKDVITSTVYFQNMEHGFKPVYAVKEYKSTTPINLLTVKKMRYKITTTYFKNSVNSFIESDDEDTLAYFRANGIVKKDATSKNRQVKKVTSTFDNDQLLFVIRGLLTKKFNSTLNVFEPTEAAKKTLNVKVSTDTASQTTAALSKEVGSDSTTAEKTFDCYKTIITLNDKSYSGTSKTAYFVNKENAEKESQPKLYANVMVKFIDPIVYLNGSLEYTLTSFVRA